MSLDKGCKTETSWEIILKKYIEKSFKFDLNTYVCFSIKLEFIFTQ